MLMKISFYIEILADLLGEMPVIETPNESATIVNLAASGREFCLCILYCCM